MGLLRMVALIGACATDPLTGGAALLTISGKSTQSERKSICDDSDADC